MVRVLPGSPEIFASLDQPVSMFINEDLPTLDLPMKPNSGPEVTGQCFNVGLLLTNEADLIIIIKTYFRSL